MDEDVESKRSRPTNYKEEIEGALKEDEQRIGDVFREKSKHDNDPEAIRKALGVPTVGTIYIHLGAIQTLLECRRITKGPELARVRARMLRSFADRHADLLTDGTKQRLLTLAHEHQNFAEDESTLAAAANRAKKHDEEQSGKPGIYVYTLPHYMNKPVFEPEEDDSNDRTYLKVGMSNRDAGKRVREQITTALPEAPLILRRYELSDPKDAKYQELEKKMHEHLNAADHNQNRETGAGKEWFLTHLPFIDSTARLLGLVPVYEYERNDENEDR
ncbi:MAG: GIY-YIG nuclease family protein [Gammaproteobacteria bacterium]|nr:GIY-YIG nuclease family protein [Gammaproteobacteria bacterium]MCY4278757.1 GIY-YIG nuclease family protein [Gammaproteobacteria bacterium]